VIIVNIIVRHTTGAGRSKSGFTLIFATFFKKKAVFLPYMRVAILLAIKKRAGMSKSIPKIVAGAVKINTKGAIKSSFNAARINVL